MAKAKSSARKSSKKAKTGRKAVSKSRSTKVARPTAGQLGSHTPTPGLEGHLTHTEFACTDPAALKAWTQKVLGWSFGAPFMMEGGEAYHLFAYGKTGGGGIMHTRDGEAPRVTPYAHVESCSKTLEKALKAGAKHIMGPDTVMPGVTLAIVETPGGIMMGFSGGK